MSAQKEQLNKILDLLDTIGAMKHVLLVGSWAEFVYEQAGLIPAHGTGFKTTDLDLLILNRRRPNPPVSFAVTARSEGYYVDHDRISGITKVWDPEGLEIEFLIEKKGAGLETALETNLGVMAQSLWHMDILKRSAIEIEFEGRDILVPSPEGYVLHKMVINHERGRKKEKDAAAVVNLWPHLDRVELAEQFERLTKKEKRRVAEFAEEHGLAMPTKTVPTHDER